MTRAILASFFFLIVSISTWANPLIYHAFETHKNGDTFLYSVRTMFTPTRYEDAPATLVETHVSGNAIQERNTVILRTGSHMAYIYQDTHNDLEHLYYSWELKFGSDTTSIFHHDKTRELTRHYNLQFPERTYSLQAVLHLLQQMPISDDFDVKFYLLVPPRNIYPLVIQTDSVEQIAIGGQPVEAYKLRLELRGLLKIFAPTTWVWLRRSPPHLLLKYKSQNQSYSLANYGTLAPNDAP